jgi:hypothetical protein
MTKFVLAMDEESAFCAIVDAMEEIIWAKKLS